MAGLFATSVGATVMLYLDLEDLVEMSDVIVAGRIVSQETFFDEKKQEVATITTVQVSQRYFGAVEDTVQFRQWGGAYDEKVSQIPGDATFEPYEECVLFLVDGQGEFAGMRYLAALGQSKYRVVRDGKDPMVFRDLSDLAFLNQATREIKSQPSHWSRMSSFEPTLLALVAGIKGGAK